MSIPRLPTAKNQIKRSLIRAIYNTLGVPSITKTEWSEIKDNFEQSCAYCGTTPPKLTKEHIKGVSEDPPGSYHRTNIIPACQKCQHRRVNSNSDPKGQVDWKTHLEDICKSLDESELSSRKNKIEKHMNPSDDLPKDIKAIESQVGKLIKIFDQKISDAVRDTLAVAKVLAETKNEKASD